MFINVVPSAQASISAARTTIQIIDRDVELMLNFGLVSAQTAVDQLDKLAAGALEIRGRLLRELATDADA